MAAIGRPTAYRREHCDTAIELGKLGKSKAQIAAKLGVHRGTLDDWATANEEFAEALKLSRTFALAWWEDLGQELMVEKPSGSRMNAQLWSRSMAARFPEDYRERSETKFEAGPSLEDLILQGLAGAPSVPSDEPRGRS